ncbi:hypothetical protein GCM10017781_33410 [Deinococcus metalli]|uniref:Uncharacterized protein n=1 Tax=Deinococcus metalli TaxID=1141878 RepID=A0ABQ3JUC1_9DEIO|nr:hypothetical protein GCM10017781_33410 [Deinococcus metalli]
MWARAEGCVTPLDPLTAESVQAGVPVAEVHLVDTGVQHEAQANRQGLRAQQELTRGDDVSAVLSLRIGPQLVKPPNLDAQVGLTPCEVPTLYIGVVAVRAPGRCEEIGWHLLDTVIAPVAATAPHLGDRCH